MCNSFAGAPIWRSTAERRNLFGGFRLGRGRRWDYCLVINIRVRLVQFCNQALGLFFFEKLRPGSDPAGDGALPADRVGFHAANWGKLMG